MQSIIKTKFFALFFVAAIAALAGACASIGGGKTAQVNVDSKGLALDGYDAVAYFADSSPREGKSEFTTEYNGATWQFATTENRDAFSRERAKYAPQYGGYCAWAVGHNYTAKGDPQAWKIVDDKL